ncbi:sulfate transporter [Klebsiella pneumoniae]|nr:sulfate transporter [Klebsiella pneumoniae]
MSGQLSWTREGETLALHGELDQDLLVPLWEARAQATAGTAIIDLSQTTRVDTAGLALLVHFVALIRRQGRGSAAGRQERKPANADRSLQPTCRSDLIIFSVP